MTPIRVTLVVGVCALMTFGCGKKDEGSKEAPASEAAAKQEKTTASPGDTAPPPTNPEGDSKSTMGVEEVRMRLSKLYDSIVVAAQDADGDCDKMATDIAKLVKDNAALIEAEKALSVEDKAAMEAKSGDDFTAVRQTMMPLVQPCESNEALGAAFDAMM